MGKDVIIACDFSSQREVMDFLDLFPDKKPYVKIMKFGADTNVYGVDKEKEIREIRRKAINANLKLRTLAGVSRQIMPLKKALKT